MSLIRRLSRQERKRYVTIEHEPLQDKRLSFGARGILAYLLTKPNDWEVKTADLVNQSNAGRRAVLNMLKELESCGYLRRRRIRLENGLYDWDTEVYEVPALAPQTQPQCSLRTDVGSTTYQENEGLKETLAHSKHRPHGNTFPDVNDDGIHDEPSRIYYSNAMVDR